MANKRTVRRPKAEKKINLLDIKEGVYLDEKSFGTVKKLEKNDKCIFGIDEYMYHGKLHKGRIGFVLGQELKQVAPVLEDFNHGYTLEGESQKIFSVEHALNVYSAWEERTFSYVNGKSELKFVGDPTKSYDIYVRIYDNAYGIENYRWVVIYAEESK